MRKNLKILFILVPAICLAVTTKAQSNQDWEIKLKECEIIIPIKGSSKFDAADHKIAKKYENIELIWLHFDKSMKKDTVIVPKKVYLISETLQNGSQVEYITPVNDYKEGINAPIFPEWKSKKNKFYLADCFEKTYKP